MAKKLIVFHRYYGCETGCCGHAVAWVEEDVLKDLDVEEIHFVDHDEVRNSFEFGHAYSKDAARRYAESLLERVVGKDHIVDLDWEHCLIYDYDTAEYC